MKIMLGCICGSRLDIEDSSLERHSIKITSWNNNHSNCASKFKLNQEIKPPHPLVGKKVEFHGIQNYVDERSSKSVLQCEVTDVSEGLIGLKVDTQTTSELVYIPIKSSFKIVVND